MMPFSWLTDHTRWVRKPQTFRNVKHALSLTARLYADEPELVKDRFASLTATRFSGVTDIRWVKRAGRPALAVINGGRA
jgi:hypothetical protein